MAKSAPKHFFSNLASIKFPRSKFPFDKVDTCTFKADYLYPNYSFLALPGDTVSLSYSNLTRFLPAIDVPMMDNVHCTVHFWAVPWRLVWKDTKYFFGEKQRGSTITDYTIPQIVFEEGTYPQSGSIYDYFEIPIQGTDNQYTKSPKFNALKYRAYNLIYDEWYMDEQRGTYSYYNDTSTNDSSTDFQLLKRNKRFDYFTTTTLEPQIGNPATLSVGNLSPVYALGEIKGSNTYGAKLVPNFGTGYGDYITNMRFASASSLGSVVPSMSQTDHVTNSGSLFAYTQSAGESPFDQESLKAKSLSGVTGQNPNVYLTPNNLWADLRSATSVSIPQLREAFQIQAYQEIQNKSGQRYTEYIYGQYGVISPDARLQRPEFLGGAEFDISVMPVVQNSGTYTTGSQQTTPQGTITGYMVGGLSKKFIFTRSFTEHTYIIGLINYYSDLTYFQGINRDDYIQTPLDIPLPVFANLSDEQVDRKELYYTGDDNVDLSAFGYIERYGWAKYAKNTLRGLVRPNAPQTLGYWSLAQQFSSNVANNQDFIVSNTDMARISAVTNSDTFIANQKFYVDVVRELPMYSDTMRWFSRT